MSCPAFALEPMKMIVHLAVLFQDYQMHCEGKGVDLPPFDLFLVQCFLETQGDLTLLQLPDNRAVRAIDPDTLNLELLHHIFPVWNIYFNNSDTNITLPEFEQTFRSILSEMKAALPN